MNFRFLTATQKPITMVSILALVVINPFKTIIFWVSCLLLFMGAMVSVDAKIVFRVDDDIFVMNDEGTGRRRLTHNTTTKDSYPRWAPDGTKIAFTRYMDKEKIQTSSELFIMNADGTDLQRLTDNNVADANPSWSSDGTQIAFTSLRGGKLDVFVIDVASQKVTQLTGFDDAKEQSAAPDWSSDGTMLTFERFIQGPGINSKTIYVMDADGQHQRPLLPDPEIGDGPTFRFFPRWSADRQHILFYEVQWLDGGDVKHLIAQSLGAAKKKITDINDRLGNNLNIAGTSWMENDRAMLISIKQNDKPNANYDLYRYTFDTRGLKRLTRDPSDEKWPDWTEGEFSVSPHGKLPTQWGEVKHTDHKRQ